MGIRYRRAAAALAALAMIVACLPGFSAAAQERSGAAELPDGEAGSYVRYLQAHADAARPTDKIVLPADRTDAETTGVEPGVPDGAPLPDGGAAVTLNEGSTAVWTVDVPQAGLYAVGFFYLPLPGKDVTIERELRIGGVLPFSGSSAVLFSRRFCYDADVPTDDAGNELKPAQSEQAVWSFSLAGGAQEYEDEPYLYYFSAGRNTLTLSGGREPLAIAQIVLTQPDILPSYADYLAAWEERGASRVSGAPIHLQAEAGCVRSDASIAVACDRTSPVTEPMTAGDAPVGRLRLNSIGGQNWRSPRQWIEWQVDVPQGGLYRLALRFKQNRQEGIAVSRRLWINGEVPFTEAGQLSFGYGNGWQTMAVGGGEGFYLYFRPGTNTVRLEVTVGAVAPVVRAVQETVGELNTAYRRILMITGSHPDADRDYDLDKELPEVMETFSRQSEELLRMADELLRQTGERGAAYARLQKTAVQLSGFVKDPDSIPERMDRFRSNISDLSAFVLDVTEQPLQLDWLSLMTEGTALPQGEAGFFARLRFEVLNFFASFVTDYDTVGGETADGVRLSLWMGASGLSGATQTPVAGASGRDQAQVIRDLVADGFTPESGVDVDIRLVDMSVLLPAVASGNGPDVAIDQEQTAPVNYALRGAVMDLARFSDLPEVLTRFSPAAYEPFRSGSGMVALPETQVYSMLFYRKDILRELSVDVPQTWDGFYHAVTVLARSDLKVGLPNLSSNDLDVFYMLLYQNGGSVYNDERDATALSSDEAVRAFTEWSELYTRYDAEQKIDVLTRFRTGEDPLAIAPFTFFNTLSTAPEIRGQWGMAPLPGTEKDGTLRRDAVSASTAAVIFANTAHPDEAWAFLKWWTSAEAQTGFGREIEIRLGEAARWPTANEEAFAALSWERGTLDVLSAQKAQIHGLPELPGSYMTNRYVATAIRLVINNGLVPREALLDCSRKIDEEIERKRWEFGMR